MARASASKSALLLSPCLRWAGPDAQDYDEDRIDADDHTKRDRGICFHEAIEHRITHDERAVVPEPVQGWVDRAYSWYEKNLKPRCVSVHCEVYVSSNFETGEVHTDQSVRGRGYPEMPGYIPGTADLVCILESGELLVLDWKTGLGTGADKQLLTLASGLRKTAEYRNQDGSYRSVRLGVLYAGEAAYGTDGVTPVEWPVTEGELVAHEDAMAFQLADVGVRNEPVVGIHCTQLYCPHLAYCPGVAGVVDEAARELIPAERLLVKMTDQPISDEEAGYTMERIAAARRQMKYLEAGIRQYINEGGKALAGDYEFKSTNSGFRWVKKNG